MTFCRIVWALDVLLLVIALAFFAIGIVDRSVSSFNIAIWLALLGGLVAVLLGSRALDRRGWRPLASALALLPAVPGLALGAVIVAAMVTGTRWN